MEVDDTVAMRGMNSNNNNDYDNSNNNNDYDNSNNNNGYDNNVFT